jgi:hypothetical protein
MRWMKEVFFHPFHLVIMNNYILYSCGGKNSSKRFMNYLCMDYASTTWTRTASTEAMKITRKYCRNVGKTGFNGSKH